MQLDNALYAGAQIAHNFGAAAALGLPLAALYYAAAGPALDRTYRFTLLAWTVQIASGAGFGLVSYFVVGELPQIGGLALAALIVKILCAALSVGLIFARTTGFVGASDLATLASLSGFAGLALFSAAILRWFS